VKPSGAGAAAPRLIEALARAGNVHDGAELLVPCSCSSMADEGELVLAELIDLVVKRKPDRLTWRQDAAEMVLWDDWRMPHSVSPCPTAGERTMRLTTIGDTDVQGHCLTERAS